MALLQHCVLTYLFLILLDIQITMTSPLVVNTWGFSNATETGEDTVTDHKTALIELVKNAYKSANARERFAYLTFLLQCKSIK